MTSDYYSNRRFDIALSFPGEHRAQVSEVSAYLASVFSEERVLYDKYHDAEFARPNLDVYLKSLYSTQSELIVVFLCPEYAEKTWCGLEFRFIRQLIGTSDEIRIMFLSIGDPGDLSDIGVMRRDGYLDILNLSPLEVSERIQKRLHLNQGLSSKKGNQTVPVDISRIVKYAPSELIGRQDEIVLLTEAWNLALLGETKRPHVLTFVALGGEGKTSLVAKWAADLGYEGWHGCEAVFAWSFYSQTSRGQACTSSDLFFKEALMFFGDEELALSAQGSYEKGRRLAQLISERRTLLILDGLEPLQYAPSSPSRGELTDQGVAILLRRLASSSRGLCVVTTRFSIPDLRAHWGKSAAEVKLSRLSNEAGTVLLKSIGVKGVQREFEVLVEKVKGHALTVNLLGAYLCEAHDGDIRKHDLVRLEDANAEEQGGHAFRVMDAYVNWFESDGDSGNRAVAILYLLGLFDRPATADCIAALLNEPAIANLTAVLANNDGILLKVTVARLEQASLATVNRASDDSVKSLDTHPLIRAYFARQLQEKFPAARKAGHRRLYEHLTCTTHEGTEPTLEELQPLYQAVLHGSLAELHQQTCDEVLWKRIRRENEIYSPYKLGAWGSDLGAISCFFENPWSRLIHSLGESTKTQLLNEAGNSLRALGRLTESIEPMRAAKNRTLAVKNWEQASICFCNLSDVELTLGMVSEAIEDAERSVAFADRSAILFRRMCNNAIEGNALFQAGRLSDANRSFEIAESIQNRRHMGHPLLISLPGFRYCDFLLAVSERIAWRITLFGSKMEDSSSNLHECLNVTERARAALVLAEQHRWLLEIALDNLILGRASFFESIILCKPIESHLLGLDSVVNGLYRASQQDHVPRGLLTRAWMRASIGRLVGRESAQTDLDEAWEIAERGPMRLHMADIHLYRARLFNNCHSYPWSKDKDGNPRGPKDDLREARNLIEKCGYWRRRDELVDAELASATW